MNPVNCDRPDVIKQLKMYERMRNNKRPDFRGCVPIQQHMQRGTRPTVLVLMLPPYRSTELFCGQVLCSWRFRPDRFYKLATSAGDKRRLLCIADWLMEVQDYFSHRSTEENQSGC